MVCALLHVVLGYNNGEGITPPMGWNTWCTMGTCGNMQQDLLHDVCNENEVMSVAEAMISNGMYELGYRYINMDDCWASMTRAANGSIQWDAMRFPSGIPALANFMHERGLKLGLYTSAGSTTCSSGGRPYNIPGSYGHYAQDAESFASWGVDYVKIDWCGKDLTNASLQHTEFSQALNATGRHIFLELCRGYSLPPPAYCPEVAQSWRVTGDHQDVFSSTLYEIAALVNQSYQAGPYHWNYADFLMTGGAGCDGFNSYHCPGQTNTEYISEFSLWAIAQSPLIVATDIRNMTEIMNLVLLNSEIITMHQDTRTPAGDFVSYGACAAESQIPLPCQLWGRNLYNTSTYAAVLFNTGNDIHNITFPFDLIEGWSSTTQAVVRDLWLHEDLPDVYDGEFTAEVPSHGVSYVIFNALPSSSAASS